MSQDAAALSLLSLSIAAASSPPIALAEQAPASASRYPQAPTHHRRLSSSTRRRRLSDARDAAARPSSIGTPGPSLPLAAHPLASASPPAHAVSMAASAPTKSSTPIPIASGGTGKKRGIEHKCETCSKIYRHPSCLIKHRWEHTPHWRTLSSLPQPGNAGVLSKHAQVQLLEAAAILSHLSPDSNTGTSLPEDRGMWPRWVSGGVLDGEAGATPVSFGGVSAASFGSGSYGPRSGPRLHDYEVPRGAEVRAGVVEVPHGRSLGHAHGHSVGSVWSVPRSVSVSASVSSEQSRSRSTPSDDDDDDEMAGRRGARVWKHEDEEFGFELDLGDVREEDEDDKKDVAPRRRVESLRYGMVEMDDIDMDMD